MEKGKLVNEFFQQLDLDLIDLNTSCTALSRTLLAMDEGMERGQCKPWSEMHEDYEGFYRALELVSEDIQNRVKDLYELYENAMHTYRA